MSSKKYAVFTMDVEAFYDAKCIRELGVQTDVSLLDGLDEYMSILGKHGIKSTLFTVGGLAPKIADKLKGYLAQGHRLALHNYEHIEPLDISPELFRKQVKWAKQHLGKIFDTEIQGFRAPCFSMDTERLEILRELGFRYDSSHIGVIRDAVRMDNFQKLRDGIFHEDGFYEFELNKQKMLGIPFPISGGGYVRMCPWDVVRSLIRRHIHSCDYYVFYLHPFEMSREKVPVYRKLRPWDQIYLSAGLKTYREKVEQIIVMLKEAGFQFVIFEELTEIMNEDRVCSPS